MRKGGGGEGGRGGVKECHSEADRGVVVKLVGAREQREGQGAAHPEGGGVTLRLAGGKEGVHPEPTRVGYLKAGRGKPGPPACWWRIIRGGRGSRRDWQGARRGFTRNSGWGTLGLAG